MGMYCNAKWMNPNPGVPREEKVCTLTQVKLCGLALKLLPICELRWQQSIAGQKKPGKVGARL